MMLIIWIPPLECVALSCPLTGGNRIILLPEHTPSQSRLYSLAFYQKLRAVCCWTTLDGESAFYMSLIIKNIFHPERDDSRSECKLDRFLLPDAAIHRWEINRRVQKINGAAPWMHIFYLVASGVICSSTKMLWCFYLWLSPSAAFLPCLHAWMKVLHCSFSKNTQNYMWSLQIGCWNKPEARRKSRREKYI